MKDKQEKKSKYSSGLFIRIDDETKSLLHEIAQLTERSQSNALRWIIRQMARNLKVGNTKNEKRG